MDPLSIAAAVAGFLSLAGQIAKTIKDYVDGVESAPKEVQSLHLEVTALHQGLQEFVMFLRKDALNGRKFDSSSVLLRAVRACQYQLERLSERLAGVSEACSNKTLPGWVTRIKWPLKKEEVQQTMVALHRFTQIFNFSMIIKNCEIMSETSSAVILQLEQNQREMETTVKTLESLALLVPPNLQQTMSEISDIKTLVSELAEFNIREVHNMSLGISDVQRRLQDDEIRQIRPLISPLEPHKRHHDIRQNRLEGTGTWFLQVPAFQRWRDSESEDANISSILACSGVPGAGKSVICSLVIDHLEERFSSDNRVCVACLYCDYQNDKIQTPVNMVGVLLKQVIAKLNHSGFLPPDTIDKLKQHLNEHKSFGLAEVCELFRKAVKQLRTFYICIDALDECKEGTREDFIHALADIANECSQSRPIRILFTTRPNIRWQELMERNSGLGSLDHFVVQAHLEDVRKYILHQIGRDGNPKCMNDRLKDEILERITETCDRMFLLPALQIQTVLDETTITKRRKALSTMPVELKTAFESTISRIQNQKPARFKQAMDVLKWTFLARRPLRVIELRHALSVEIDASKMRSGYLPLVDDEKLDLDNLPSEESLIDWCFGLIVIDEETSTIRLVHKSLHDYLTELYGLGEIFLNGHTEIALTCLQYMRFNDYKHEIDATESHVSGDIKRRRRETFCLLDYAIDNFGKHLQDKSEFTPDMICAFFPESVNVNCISTGLRSEFLLPFYRWDSQNDAAQHEYILENQIYLRLHFAISRGLEKVFATLLERSGQTIDFNTSLGGSTILLQACYVGNESIVRILLNRGVDINLAARETWTPLIWACRNGHHSVVKLLLQVDGIDINSKDPYGRTALYGASLCGHDLVVKLLLQVDGIDINSKDYRGRTALSIASAEGHDSVVKLLLQKDGIDINSKDMYGRTALSLASEEGHESVVKLLLQVDGIDINLKDQNGDTALSMASRNGRDSTVKLLLQVAGIDINSKDRRGWTALSLASLRGHGSTVKLLLQADGIDINSKDKDGDTALSMASRHGYDSVVKLLLQEDGIDINSKDENGNTALSWASLSGHDSVVKLLLEAGAIDGREIQSSADTDHVASNS